MSGGGDTPVKTLWKIQGAEGYSFGVFQNKNLYIEGPSGNELFLANADGRILNTQYLEPSAIPQLKEALSAYFGEIKTLQVSIVTGLAIGDDVPNWEDYQVLNL